MTRSPSILLLLFFAVAPALAAEGDARVAVPRSDQEANSRAGFFLGFGLGGGGMTLSDSGSSLTQGAALFNLRIGAGLNEKLLLMGENHEAATTIDDETHALGTLSFAAQYFVWQDFYVRPGVGVAFVQTRNLWDFSPNLKTHAGFAALAAAGYEFRMGRYFALSPEIEGNYTRVLGMNLLSYGALVGCNWYF